MNVMMVEALRGCEVFRGMGDAEIARSISAGLGMQRCLKGSIIAHEQERVKGLGILIEGRAEIQRIYESGKAMTLATIGKGEVFGEAVLFSDQPYYPATVTAVEDSAVVFIDARTMLDMVYNNRHVLLNYLNMMSGRVLRLNGKVRELSLSLRQRLADRLLAECERQQSEDITLPCSRREMAEQMGIPRPSLSREFAALRDEGLIEFDGKSVSILNKDGLENCIFE